MKTEFYYLQDLRKKRIAFAIDFVVSMILFFFFGRPLLNNIKEHLFEVSSHISPEHGKLFLSSFVIWIVTLHLVFSILDYFHKSDNQTRLFYWILILGIFFLCIGLLFEPGPEIIGMYYWSSRILISFFALGTIFSVIFLLFSLMFDIKFKITKNKKS